MREPVGAQLSRKAVGVKTRTIEADTRGRIWGCTKWATRQSTEDDVYNTCPSTTGANRCTLKGLERHRQRRWVETWDYTMYNYYSSSSWMVYSKPLADNFSHQASVLITFHETYPPVNGSFVIIFFCSYSCCG